MSNTGLKSISKSFQAIITVFATLFMNVMGGLIVYPFNLNPDLSKISPIENNVVLVSSDEQNGVFNIAKKNPDGSYNPDFKILCFTDIHIDGLNTRIQDTYDWIRYNIEKQKPDFVAFLGDSALCYFNRTRTKEIADIMDAYGIYWTTVLGNHEGESRLELSREKTMELYSESEKCLVSVSVDGVNGFGNQIINIMSSDTQISQSLYFMDSGGDKINSETKYIQKSQVDWYERTLTSTLENYGDIKSMIFMHMPLHKYEDAWQAVENGETEPLWGERNERICCSESDEQDSFLFQKAKELGSTWAFVCGHDHVNDFAVMYEGIELIYNQASGYSCYDMYSKLKDSDPTVTEAVRIQGCTVYTVHADGTVGIESIINAKQNNDA